MDDEPVITEHTNPEEAPVLTKAERLFSMFNTIDVLRVNRQRRLLALGKSGAGETERSEVEEEFTEHLKDLQTQATTELFDDEALALMAPTAEKREVEKQNIVWQASQQYLDLAQGTRGVQPAELRRAASDLVIYKLVLVDTPEETYSFDDIEHLSDALYANQVKKDRKRQEALLKRTPGGEYIVTARVPVIDVAYDAEKHQGVAKKEYVGDPIYDEGETTTDEFTSTDTYRHVIGRESDRGDTIVIRDNDPTKRFIDADNKPIDAKDVASAIANGTAVGVEYLATTFKDDLMAYSAEMDDEIDRIRAQSPEGALAVDAVGAALPNVIEKFNAEIFPAHVQRIIKLGRAGAYRGLEIAVPMGGQLLKR